MASYSWQRIHGTSQRDWLTGSDAKKDYIYAGDGDDIAFGYGGNDRLYGQGGNDTLLGGAGNDYIDGGSGDDFLYGGSGHDTISDGEGDDHVDAGSGNDTIIASLGDDTIIGGSGMDTLDYSQLETSGEWGIRVTFFNPDEGEIQQYFDYDQVSGVEAVIGTDERDFFAGNGSYSFYGGLGDDTFGGAEGADHFDGGGHFDTVDYADSAVGVTVDLVNGTGSGGLAEGDTYVSIEAISGSDHDDVLIGNDVGNRIYGEDGSDVIIGGLGNDIMKGDGYVPPISSGWADTFVFADTRDLEEDEIWDFEPGVDRLDFSDMVFTGWGDLFNGGDRYMEQEGEHTVIHYYDHTIMLLSVSVDELSEDGFIF